MASSSRRLRRSLVGYAFACASLATLSAGIFMITRDRGLSTESVLSAIGLNLIASVIFAVIFSLISSRVQERAVEENVEEGFGRLSNDLIGRVADINRTFLPLATYPPLDPLRDYGDSFNYDMTSSLNSTRFYAFRGPSGRFVAARLRKARRHPQQVKVAMLSPGDRRAIVRRSTDRSTWARSNGKVPAALQKELQGELIMSVVSLFDCRLICPIELVYLEDTAVYRYEMFDDSVYVSWYHSPRSLGREMPESFRFSADSFSYQTLRLDLIRRFEISDHKVTFDAGHDESFLIDHLTGLLGTAVSAADIDRWRAEYETYVQDFLKYMDHVTGNLDRINEYPRETLR